MRVLFIQNGIEMTEKIPPTIFGIFGGAGDLTWRKLVPALYDLFNEDLVPDQFSILSISHHEMTDENLKKRLRDGVEKFSRTWKGDNKAWNKFSKHFYYIQGNFEDAGTYKKLKEKCSELEKQWSADSQKIFYLATPPSLFGIISELLGNAGLGADVKRSRIIIEKPIGSNLETAVGLKKSLAKNFREDQIFRMDHYLGKETVQNILAFRFANPLFEPIWNRHYVDYIAITVAETLGVEHRGNYYEKAGALRDMVQNHLFQLLCLVAMEPMVSFDANEIRNKKVDVLHAVRPIPKDGLGRFVARGQYGKGRIDDQLVCAYREEPDVAESSFTETYVALKVYVDNWRWQGVPFYLRTGKRLPKQMSEIVIQFRSVPHRSFPKEALPDWQASRIIISIQPDEGIDLRFKVKEPGTKFRLRPVDMQFNYADIFPGTLPDAYETLLWDIMRNDTTLFMREDQVEAAWQILSPVLEVWAEKKPLVFPNYSAGTWGPDCIFAMLEQEKHIWKNTAPSQIEIFKKQTK